MSKRSGWRKMTVASVCKEVSVGIVIRPAQYYTNEESGVKTFRSTNVGDGRVNDRDWVYISKDGHRKNMKSELKTGDVLVVRSGAPGTSCVVPEELSGSNCIDIVFARPRTDIILPDYLSLFTNSDIGKRQIVATQGGLALKHFNVGAHKKMIVNVPDISEQAAITELLSITSRIIEKTERLIATKEQRKKIFMDLLLTGKRRLRGFQKHWSEYRLGDLFTGLHAELRNHPRHQQLFNQGKGPDRHRAHPLADHQTLG